MIFDPQVMKELLARQKQAVMVDGLTSAELRIERLERLESVLVDNQRAWVEALDQDFGGRPVMQSRMEIYAVLESIRHAKKNVRRWMRPEPRPLSWMLRLEQYEQTLAKGQHTWTQAEQENSALRGRCETLQGEVARLGEARDTQGQQIQSLQEHLLEAHTQLKLLGHPPMDTSRNQPG